MVNSALLETLAVFTTDELEDFHRFVHSPFFNEGSYARDCTALWEHLRLYAPGFDHHDLEAKRVYVRVFPGKTWVKGKLEVVMSKLHQLAKRYAAMTTPVGVEVPESLRLTAFFRQRGLLKRAAAQIEKPMAAQRLKPVHDAGYWYERFAWDFEKHLLDSDLQNLHAHEHLAAALHDLHHAYLTQTLSLLNSLFFARRKSKVEDGFAERLADVLPGPLSLADLAGEPLMRLLVTGFDFVRHPEKHGEAALRAFWQDLETHEDILQPELLRVLFTYARNHCTWQFNHGKMEYAGINLALFKSCFQRGLLFEHGKIQAATYLNMVQAGLFALDFDWLDVVMPQCRHKITGVPEPSELYNYTRANYHYHRREYDTALKILQMASDDLFNNLMARKLELKIYFETDSPLLEAKIENFKLFVFRQGKKRLPADVLRMNNAFVSFLRDLTNVTASNRKAKAPKLMAKLEANKLVAERLWLQEQLEKLLQPTDRRNPR